MPSAEPRLSATLPERLAATPIPAATIARLPGYLRALQQLAAGHTGTVSSGDLAEAAGVSSAQLRKDLSYLGSYGTRGVGYDVDYLRRQIGREMGSAHEWPVIVVGLGNLGTALANYSGFASRGLPDRGDGRSQSPSWSARGSTASRSPTLPSSTRSSPRPER